MPSKRKNDKVAPNARDSGCRISEKPAGLVVAEELARIRKALEDIASKLAPQYLQCPQCPQVLQWQRTPTPAAPHWDRTPGYPGPWDGSPRITC